MIIQRQALDSLLLNNVCDIRFKRRKPAAGKALTRRMICTKSLSLLNSTNGRVSLNYKPPTGPKRFNESSKNLIVVWDILMQDYRTINVEECEVIQQIPATEDFWKYFNDNIYPMSTEQKINLMNI